MHCPSILFCSPVISVKSQEWQQPQDLCPSPPPPRHTGWIQNISVDSGFGRLTSVTSPSLGRKTTNHEERKAKSKGFFLSFRIWRHCVVNQSSDRLWHFLWYLRSLVCQRSRVEYGNGRNLTFYFDRSVCIRRHGKRVNAHVLPGIVRPRFNDPTRKYKKHTIWFDNFIVYR